jgi:hypothetical protein
MELIHYAYQEHKYLLICDAFIKTPNLLTCVNTAEDLLLVLNMFRKRYFYNGVYKILAQKLIDIDKEKSEYAFPMLWYYLYFFKLQEFKTLYEDISMKCEDMITLRMLNLLFKIAIFDYDNVYNSCYDVIYAYVCTHNSCDALNLYHLTLPITNAQHVQICMADNDKQLSRYPSKIYSFDRYYHYNHIRIKKLRPRIGFFSNDFFNRPTGQLTINVIRHLSELVDIYIYCHAAYTKDDFFDRFKSYACKFTEIPISFGPKEISDMIYHDQLQVLIDLKGRMICNQLEIFKYKPAPIQASWIAYPGTSGLKEMDYFFGDEIVFGDDQLYPEKLIYFPICYQPNNDAQTVEYHEFLEADLKIMNNPSKIILANVNIIYKLDKPAIMAYKKILDKNPQVVIFLLLNPNCSNVVRYFENDRDRIFFFHYLPKPNHLYRLLKYVDIGLDTFYCNSHTTASDMLFAGVPIVTLQGQTFHSRVCSSLLHYVGCDEYIAKTSDEYVSIVQSLIDLGKESLAEVKKTIRYKLFKSNIYNSYMYAEYFKTAMDMAIDTYINGMEPSHLRVPTLSDYNSLVVKHLNFVIMLKSSDINILKFYIGSNEFICLKSEDMIYFNGSVVTNSIMSQDSFKLLIKDYTVCSGDGKIFDLIPWDADQVTIRMCKPIIFGSETLGLYTCQIGVLDE